MIATKKLKRRRLSASRSVGASANMESSAKEEGVGGMSEHPEGLAHGTTVEDVAEIRSGNGFPKKYQGRKEGELPFFKVGDISRNWQKGQITLTIADHYITRTESKQIRARTLPEGSVVFAKIGAAVALNRRAILATEALVDNNVMALVPSEATTSRFLFYFMCQVDLGAATRGGAVPSLRKGDVGTLTIPLPPLPEQRRIVARIEEIFSRLDAGVAALRHAKAQLQHYRQSVLAAAVTGQLTQSWREHQISKVAEASRLNSSAQDQRQDVSAALAHDPSAAASAKAESAEKLLERILKQRRKQWTGRLKAPVAGSSNTSELPATWLRVTVDQLLVEPMCNGLSMKGSDEPPGVPALKLNAMGGETIDYRPRRYLQADSPKVERIWIREGDFFVCRGNGSVKLVGRGCRAGTPPDKVIFPDTMIRLRFAKQLRDSRWCSTIWNAGALRYEIERRAKTTSGLYKISQDDIASIELPLPPLAEQHQIVAEVEARTTAIVHLETELDCQIARSNRLRQSTLAHAFNRNL